MKIVKLIPSIKSELLEWLALFLMSLSLGPMSTAVHAQTLLKQADLAYQGAFRLPAGKFGGSSFDYGGSALAYNPANDSLFIVGHDWHQMVAEISIPQVVTSANIAGLKTATVLQPFVEATEGKMFTVGSGIKVGGLLVHQGKLVMSAFSFYDANASQQLSHFSRPLSLSLAGHVSGPYKVGTVGAGFVSGYMTQTPQPWQASLGGPALTGNCCLSILSRTSYGPGVFSFDPANIGAASPLVYYPQKSPTLGQWNVTSSVFNGTTWIRGVVFPEGSQSVLFFGRQGIGTYCYGAEQCNDPTGGAQGNHAYPYVYQAWGYNAADLAAVKAGSKQPWEVVPYAIWNFTLPFQHVSGLLGGVAYDPATQRIFVVQSYGDAWGMPVIHVWKVSAGASTPTKTSVPSAPTRLTVTNTAILSWTGTANSTDVIEIERSDAGKTFNRIASVEASITSVEDRNALGGVCYRVRAVNHSASSDYSNTACAMVTDGADVVINLENGLVPRVIRRTSDTSNRVYITVHKSATVIINGKVQ